MSSIRNKQNIIFLVILVLLASLFIPHHHHNGKVCFVTGHHTNYSLCDNEHNSNETNNSQPSDSCIECSRHTIFTDNHEHKEFLTQHILFFSLYFHNYYPLSGLNSVTRDNEYNIFTIVYEYAEFFRINGLRAPPYRLS